MSIIALLTGGFVGTLTALIALFGIGVDWSTGATVYFATAATIALPIIGIGTVNRHNNKAGPNISDWEQELHGFQPNAMIAATIERNSQQGEQDRNAA